jgi:hypothetical protein
VPFLKFGRDKRGYETTSLVHAIRRQGRSRHKVLYWFRTPPGVKVGRPALDEAAIRSIEEHNPDIEFDWPKILEAKPPVVQQAEPRSRQSRRERPGQRQPVRRPSPSDQAAQEPAADAPQGEPSQDSVDTDLEDDAPSEADVAAAVQQITHPEAEEPIEAPVMPLEQAAAPEDLTRLRARYAELLARIAERAGTPERIEALRAEAEALNPDTWVTDEEARKGLAEFGPKLREIRLALGLRRRRSRRGGRRRRNAPEPGSPASGEGGGEAG